MVGVPSAQRRRPSADYVFVLMGECRLHVEGTAIWLAPGLLVLELLAGGRPLQQFPPTLCTVQRQRVGWQPPPTEASLWLGPCLCS